MINWLEEIRGKEELTQCKHCGINIWKFWNVNMKRQEYCGPCTAKLKIDDTQIKINKFGEKEVV